MGFPGPTEDQVKELIAAIHRCGGNKSEGGRQLKMPISTVWKWLDYGERVYKISIPKFGKIPKGRLVMNLEDGVIFVGGDAHYWPGPASTAHRAFVKFIGREKNLAAVIVNGDSFDFPAISRHAMIGWTSVPSPREEFEVVAERLGEIEKAATKRRGVRLIHPMGNHDARWETKLANSVPQVAGVFGTSLRDHLPIWEPCWSVHVNDKPGGAIIKHRIAGGVHATYTNVMKSGRTTVTNHLHALQCRPYTDANGTRWGVDAGCLADTYSPAFQDYLEDNPVRNWRSGFVRLKWIGGQLLTPELIRVVEDGVVEFRGELIEV